MSCFLEATPRLELGVEILQTSALPLGYVAERPCEAGPPRKRQSRFRGERRKELVDMELPPQAEAEWSKFLPTMERATRLELATSTLARWRSTR